MKSIKQVINTGDTLTVEIDRTGASGDYIAYPVNANEAGIATSGDGIHLSRGSTGMRAKVGISSMSEGYPSAKIIEVISRSDHKESSTKATPPISECDGLAVGDDNPIPESDPPIPEIDPEQFGLRDLHTEKQRPSLSRWCADESSRGKQIRSDVNRRWR